MRLSLDLRLLAPVRHCFDPSAVSVRTMPATALAAIAAAVEVVRRQNLAPVLPVEIFAFLQVVVGLVWELVGHLSSRPTGQWSEPKMSG